MNRKIIGLIIILFGVVLIAGIIYILFVDNNFFDKTLNIITAPKAQNTDSSKDTNKQTTEQVTKITTNINKEKEKATITAKETIEKQPPRNVDEEALIQMASNFVERFGTYSNQSNFNNITDLTVFMSRSMKRWAENYLNEKQEQESSSDIYYGITTKVISKTVRSFNDSAGQAIILVKTLRREATGTTYNISNTFKQDILVTFRKENGIWKVDAAYWQE